METAEDILRPADFNRLRGLIQSEAGIHLGPEKKTMLEVRLRRRVRDLQFPTVTAYCEFVFSAAGRKRELAHLLDVVTTNKTDFFREAEHFDFLVTKALPDLDARRGGSRKALIWSAGCSTGEEPYTLAMVLSEYAQTHPGFAFHVLATDISTSVLEKAGLGIFRSETVRPVPPALRQRYLMRSRDPESNLVRVVPELREKIQFRRLNFMDAEYGISAPQDIIFCRNVIIYFDRPTQIRLLAKMASYLSPGGYFFAGHSESLQNMNLPLVSAGPSIYRKAA